MFLRNFCFVIFSLLIFGLISDAQDFDDFETQDFETNMERSRRTPYFLYPQRRIQWNSYFMPEENEDDFKRKRRGFHGFGPSQKFLRWRQLVDGETAKRNSLEDEEDEEGEEPMIRRRRMPLLYPGQNYNNFKRYYEVDDDNDLDFKKKRVFLPLKKRALKKRTILNDELTNKKRKRDMGETLSNDDLGSFGYDKRQLEDLYINDLEDEEEDKKRRKKRN